LNAWMIFRTYIFQMIVNPLYFSHIFVCVSHLFLVIIRFSKKHHFFKAIITFVSSTKFICKTFFFNIWL
jgi:hypothetical protein